MAALDDDILLCIFSYCRVDTFLNLRLLSKPIFELISRNLRTLCNDVARNTFPGQLELLVIRSTEAAHDIQWLKGLRFKQLAAILVECTNQNNQPSSLLNAESPGGRHHRHRMDITFRLLADLSCIAIGLAEMSETELQNDVAFALPDYSEHVRRVMEKRRRLPGWDPPPIVGKPELAPFVLSEQSLLVWKRRWTILRRQIDHMEKHQHLWGHDFTTFEEALVFELSGRPQPLLGSRMPVEINKPIKWSGELPTALKVLQNRYHWLWTTIVDLGPQAFWAHWAQADGRKQSLVDRISSLWERESFEEKVIKALVGEAFFAARTRVTKTVGRSCHLTPRRAPQPYTVFHVSRKPSEMETLETPRMFAHIDFDFRLQPNALMLHESDIPV